MTKYLDLQGLTYFWNQTKPIDHIETLATGESTKAVQAGAIKTYVNAQVASVPHFAIAVVDTLPTTDISGTTVYLVRQTPGSTNQLYTEYIYVNSAWEKLGDASINIDDYAKTTDLTTAIQQEAARAKGAEEANAAAITAEATARGKADTTLQTNITTEVTRAKSAETSIDSAVGLTKSASEETRTYSNTGNYIGKNTKNTVTSDIKALDTQTKTNADAIATNATNITTLQTSVGNKSKVTWTQTQTTGDQIATINIDGTDTAVYAPKPFDTASTADKVANYLVVKVNDGTTEDTNLQSFNGAAAKSVNILNGVAGSTAVFDDTTAATAGGDTYTPNYLNEGAYFRVKLGSTAAAQTISTYVDTITESQINTIINN